MLAAYGEVLAREYSDWAYSRLHRLTVDTYAVQHPGQPNRQGDTVCEYPPYELVRSAGTRQVSAEATKTIGLAVSKKGSYVWLDPPQSMGAITVAEVRATTSLEEHLATVQKWAQSAWAA